MTYVYQRGAGQVLAEPKIISVAALAGRDVPGDKFGCCEPPNSVRWIVHAQGTFFNEHGGPGPGRRFFGTDAWMLYNDSGTDVGFEFSELRANLTGRLAGDAAGGCTWLVDQTGTRWEVAWPDGWKSNADSSGDLVLRGPSGQNAARAGSTIGVTGSMADGAAVCGQAQQRFLATAIVYFSFGPEN